MYCVPYWKGTQYSRDLVPAVECGVIPTRDYCMLMLQHKSQLGRCLPVESDGRNAMRYRAQHLDSSDDASPSLAEDIEGMVRDFEGMVGHMVSPHLWFYLLER